VQEVIWLSFKGSEDRSEIHNSLLTLMSGYADLSDPNKQVQRISTNLPARYLRFIVYFLDGNQSRYEQKQIGQRPTRPLWSLLPLPGLQMHKMQRSRRSHVVSTEAIVAPVKTVIEMMRSIKNFCKSGYDLITGISVVLKIYNNVDALAGIYRFNDIDLMLRSPSVLFETSLLPKYKFRCIETLPSIPRP
jgi:hypothetical protein